MYRGERFLSCVAAKTAIEFHMRPKSERKLLKVLSWSESRFRAETPEGADLSDYFLDVARNELPQCEGPLNRQKTRLAAWDLVTNHPAASINDVRKCIDWYFSESRNATPEATFTPYHLAALLTRYRRWRERYLSDAATNEVSPSNALGSESQDPSLSP